MSTTRAARLAGGLLAGGLLLTGCSFTSENVSCSGGSCSVTLTGDGAQAEILNTTLTFGGVQDGRATLSVGGASVSCGEGESVSAGPLQLACSGITEDSVELTASVN
ncbi:hypothetical protein [Blastococcus saxobsidens]|uniref:Lipoprotein n=1 Tax=Blastococcus saxobsidens TaxID=138336 RepID=A0A4Q7YA46_9ACTN|nr:hypothetical protein [Blastococcus saxobsidens]RZU33424.1 hypothetical protein BKA19_3148 [Blastococcus saxobsidens]